MTNQPHNPSSEAVSVRDAARLLWRALGRTWTDFGTLDRCLLVVVAVVFLFVVAGLFR